MPVILDLCSGLGGASEAFTLEEWTVIRIENNPELEYVPDTRILDVREWPNWIEDIPRCDVIWASPPCREFSRAYDAPAPRAERAGEEFEPDMSIVQACLDIIDFMKPEIWTLENVIGAVPFISELIGEPSQKLGPFVLWGNHPHIHMPWDWSHSKFDNDSWSTDPLRANKRALIPFEVSHQYAHTLEQQWTLRRWF